MNWGSSNFPMPLKFLGFKVSKLWNLSFFISFDSRIITFAVVIPDHVAFRNFAKAVFRSRLSKREAKFNSGLAQVYFFLPVLKHIPETPLSSLLSDFSSQISSLYFLHTQFSSLFHKFFSLLMDRFSFTRLLEWLLILPHSRFHPTTAAIQPWQATYQFCPTPLL